jgi:two-component system KDP operon response regulator KdpE
MNATEGRILVIEDTAHIRKFLRISLEAHRYEVTEARLGAEGLDLCAARYPDLVILDLKLPDMDGMDVIPRLREWTEVPILVLSVRAEETEKVAALDAGANDYVTKPFGIGELMARIRVLLRKQKEPDDSASVYESGGLRIDFPRRAVAVDGVAVHLTRKEYRLLHLLIGASGRVLTHQQILREVWGPAQEHSTHYLRVLVRQLRNKLGDEPARPRFILTEPGVGYRFLTPSD